MSEAHGHGHCCGRPPSGPAHRAAAGRPRTGAGVQPPAGAGDREQHRHHRHHRRSTPTRCGTCGSTWAPARSPPSSPRPPPCWRARPGWPDSARGTARPLPESANAARPTLAARGATLLVAWLEWQEGAGDRLVAELRTATTRTAAVVFGGPEDLFHPTAAVTSDGDPWLLFGRSVGAEVGVWASRFDGGRWSSPQPISDTDGPSFNQEVVASADGGLHVCWQGRAATGWRLRTALERQRVGADGPRRQAGLGQRLGPDPHPGRRRSRLRVDRVPERQLRRRAASPRRTGCRPGAPAHRRHRLRAAPEPGRGHRRPPLVRLRRHQGAGPRRQRTHPAAAPLRGRRTGRRVGRHAGAGGERASGAAPPKSAPASGWSPSTGTLWWSPPVSSRAG